MNDQIALVNMIKQQLRTGNVLDEGILNLYEEIKREDFVPEQYRQFAYSDMQIPLNHNQRMLTPLEEGLILQALELKGNETVLEVGTGSGFLSALLAKSCKFLYTVEYYADLAASAQKKLERCLCSNVEVLTGDGSKGWLDKAPYDVIVMTGGIEKIEDLLRLQVIPGGKLFTIIGRSPAMQGQLLSLDHKDKWSMDALFETDIPLLINKIKPDVFTF